MNPARVLIRLLVVAAVWLAPAGLFAQAKPAEAQKPFEPQVGQQGKDVVWVPTADILVQKMLDMAKVTAKDLVMDLGSGDGRTVIAAAKRGATAIGVEFNPDMVALSRQRAAEAGVKASIIQGDLFEADLSKATVITMFLLPTINVKLRPTILDLKPGTRIVSNTFTMEEWDADEEAHVEGECTSWCTALFWVVPAKVAGTWRLGQSDLTITQQFQKISGTLGSTPVEGRLLGEEITFTAEGTKYTGKVAGGIMQGTNGTGTWSATRR